MHWNQDSPKLPKISTIFDTLRHSNSCLAVITGLSLSIKVPTETFTLIEADLKQKKNSASSFTLLIVLMFQNKLLNLTHHGIPTFPTFTGLVFSVKVSSES